MQPYVIVAWVGAGPREAVFAKSAWPLHLTLLRFDAPADVGIALADPVMAAAPSIGVRVGADAGFGHGGRVPVSLVEPEPDLQQVHESLARAVEAAGGRLPGAQHNYANFRPHISFQRSLRVHPGDRLQLTEYGLVDMRPDGDTSVRRIRRRWRPD